MLQRKQSIWLFLATLCNAGVFLFDIYRVSYKDAAGTVLQNVLRVANNYPLLLIALVMTLLPLITIFMFRNRKKQMSMTAVSMVATLAFISMMLVNVNKLERSTPGMTGGTYWVGAVLPVIALIFIVMSLAGIRKDEKLVRSMDRLR